jgi:hypothetical protein
MKLSNYSTLSSNNDQIKGCVHIKVVCKKLGHASACCHHPYLTAKICELSIHVLIVDLTAIYNCIIPVGYSLGDLKCRISGFLLDETILEE